MIKLLFWIMTLKIMFSKLLSHLSGYNELRHQKQYNFVELLDNSVIQNCCWNLRLTLGSLSIACGGTHNGAYQLQRRHNEHDGVSNQQPDDCLLNRLFWCGDETKHQNSASLAFVSGIHRWPVISPHKGPVKQKCFHLMTSSCPSK